MTWQPQVRVLQELSFQTEGFLIFGLSLFQQKKAYPWEADTFHKHAYLVKKLFSTEK